MGKNWGGGRGKRETVRKKNQNIRHRDLSLLGREEKSIYIRERVKVRGVKGGKIVYMLWERKLRVKPKKEIKINSIKLPVRIFGFGFGFSIGLSR